MQAVMVVATLQRIPALAVVIEPDRTGDEDFQGPSGNTFCWIRALSTTPEPLGESSAVPARV
jgi:hypothetical protein